MSQYPGDTLVLLHTKCEIWPQLICSNRIHGLCQFYYKESSCSWNVNLNSGVFLVGVHVSEWCNESILGSLLPPSLPPAEEVKWNHVLYFKPSWSWRRQMDPVATVNLMCFASASIMFLLIRVVRVLESVPAGIYPEPVSSPSQDTHTYTHTYIMTLTARG